MDRAKKVKRTFNKHSERYEKFFSEPNGKIVKKIEKRR